MIKYLKRKRWYNKVKKLEIIGKEIEIYKIKLFLFMAIAGGSWVYTLKFTSVAYKIMLIAAFAVASFGTFLNMSKLSNLQKDLERLKNG